MGWCPFRSSKPAGDQSVSGAFDSHGPPPRLTKGWLDARNPASSLVAFSAVRRSVRSQAKLAHVCARWSIRMLSLGAAKPQNNLALLGYTNCPLSALITLDDIIGTRYRLSRDPELPG